MSIGSNVFIRFPEIFTDEKLDIDDVRIYGREGNERKYKWTSRTFVAEHPNLYKYKVFVTGANGNGVLGETLSTPVIGEPGTGYTQTFISFGAFENKFDAESLLKYFKTKFLRIMLGTLKITQNNKTKAVWQNVPLQDFTVDSDINWSQSIAEIDQQLYRKYELSAEEIMFIEENVKEMG